jgi:hypothetical protein
MPVMDEVAECAECGADLPPDIRDAYEMLYGTSLMSKMATPLERIIKRHPEWSAEIAATTALYEAFGVDLAAMYAATAHRLSEKR